MSPLQTLNWKGFHAYDFIVTTLTLVKLGAFIHSYKRKTWLVPGDTTDKKGVGWKHDTPWNYL